ncbi:TonB-dependent receptor [Microbulbifer sp. ALW1]|uniref:TonB-dependent receptor n=1 Tax=Microbulbifer sp. (strain ALW1) TaxID=1516059 RepID=UPI00135AE9EF|nr:TonB-dependent receptor [Microbulbifer sp. ALW1]
MNRLKLLPAAIALAVTQGVYAQESTSESDALKMEAAGESQTGNIEEIVVLGNMFDTELRALGLQRASVRIVNIVSADGIGKLPDRNAAEAVQRVSGVSIERDQGEGRFVAVRGLPSEWSSASLNGHRLPSAEEETTSRATAFDFFPSELIERIEVTKAVTADQEGDAIGGNVNFITRTAPDERTLQVSVGGGIADKADGDIKSMNLLYGDRSEDEKFGYLINVTGWSRDWATDNFEPRRDGNGIYRLELRDYIGNRETLGMNLGAEYNFSDDDRVFVRALYGTLSDEETHYKHRLRFDKDRVELQHIHNELITEMKGVEFGGEHDLSETAKVDWSLASYDNEFRYGNIPNGKDRSYFVMRFDQKEVGYEGLAEDGLVYNEIDGGNDPANAISTHLPDGFVMDPAQAALSWVELYKVYVNEKDKIVASVDFTSALSSELELKMGMKYRDKERVSIFADEFYEWTGDNPVYLSDFALSNQPGRNDYLSDINVDYASQFSQVASMSDLERFWSENRDQFALVEDESALVSNGAALGRNFDLAEQHLSGYGMATYQLNDRTTIVAGLRLTQTTTEVDSQVYVEDENGQGRLEPFNGEKDYLSVLPSAHLKYALNDDSNLRLALTRTFARPNFGDLNPGGYYAEHDNEFLGGNAELEPTYSWNLDAIYEHYFGDAGVASAGFFYKDITDPIFESVQEGSYNGNTGVDIYRPENGDDAWLRGFEFNLVRKLDFLPGPLANLGVSANVTVMDSEMTIPGRDEAVPIARQADLLHNFSVYYDDGDFSLRLAQNHKDEYVEEHGGNADEDQFYGKYTSLDLSANYTVNDRLVIFAEAINLTDEPLTYYIGSEDRPKQVEYYGARGQFGVRYSFY